MSAPLIILAHAADTNALAAYVSRRMSNLGYGVERRLLGAGHTQQALSDGIATARRLIVLWSPGTAAVANLHTQLRRAEATGKLSVIRLASSPTPTRLKNAVLKLPRGGDDNAAWRELADKGTQRPGKKLEASRSDGASRLHALLVFAVMGLVAASAGYASHAAFAEQVNTLAALALGGK